MPFYPLHCTQSQLTLVCSISVSFQCCVYFSWLAGRYSISEDSSKQRSLLNDSSSFCNSILCYTICCQVLPFKLTGKINDKLLVLSKINDVTVTTHDSLRTGLRTTQFTLWTGLRTTQFWAGFPLPLALCASEWWWGPTLHIFC